MNARLVSCLPVLVLFGAFAFMPSLRTVNADEPSLIAAANHQVAIPRAALGKEYLLSASSIPQTGAPTSTGLAGRVVVFELFHDGVDLYESGSGQVVTNDLPSRRLLATFPITAQDDQSITIDFNQGMKRLIAQGWYSSGRSSPEEHAMALELTHSRVFSVEQVKNRLVVRQAAQVRDRQSSPNLEARFEIRYFISPYKPTDIPPKENLDRDARYVRYFESQPQIELSTGRPSSKIARFDIREPVLFYYSANTPEPYVDAVREGILYWNRAFGKEVIKAEKAPDGVSAPNAELNIVQWVPFDNAGFAYADILIDPRTGQSLHGQAYITSVFAFSGKQKSRAILRTLTGNLKEEKKEEAKDDKKGHRHFGMPFLEPTCSCQWDTLEFSKQMVLGLEAILAEPDASEAKILLASQDYVRNVVAHEVGHVLGLRHNFAGSLGANVSPAELDQWFNDYLTKDALPDMKGKYTTNSIMEYSILQAAVFTGCKIRTTDDVLPHDKAAIQWGYADSLEAKENKLLFAPDDAQGTYGDVRTFDYGTEPILAEINEISTELRTLPNSLIESFVAAKAPLDPRDRIPLDEVNLNPNMRASMLAASYGGIFQWFQAGTRSLRLERDFPFVGPLNQEDLLKVRWEKLNDELKRAGGIDRVVFSFLPVNLQLNIKDAPQGAAAPEKFEAAKMTAKVAELLDSPAYKSFVGADGQTYAFTDEEKELIKKRAKLFFDEFEKEWLKRACQALGRAGRDLGVQALGTVSEDDVIAQLEKQIVALGRTIVMAKDEGKVRRGKLSKSTIEVTEFKYDAETRAAAAQMLADNIGSYRSWSREARGGIHNELKAEVESALNIPNLKAFSDAQLTRPLREWYLEQQSVLALLPPAPPPPGGAPGAPGGLTEPSASAEKPEH
ncbi:MAG: hypothetical protein FJ297_18790 [Planctomycetes bacterium]|nr:hypothetical protein [Planctomycetota bacterium]